MRTIGCFAVLSLLLLSANLASAEGEYSVAYHDSQKSGRPLLVLIGADWCPACVRMKQEVIPELRSRGLLKQVAFAELDKDRHPKTSAKLMTGELVPQLVLFYQTADGWKRQRIVGAGSVAKVDAMLQQSLHRVAVTASGTMPQ